MRWVFALRLVLILGIFWNVETVRDAIGSDSESAADDPSYRLLKDAALMVLKEGNHRFVAGKAQHPNQDAGRRGSTFTEGQEPLATVLSCSDSRVPSELVFDRGVGDLFVIRVAGNVVDKDELATIEYGVEHLRTPLLIIVGHTGCGAVKAAIDGTELHGHLPGLVAKIQPAVEKAKQSGAKPTELWRAAVHANVWQSVEEILSRSTIVRARAKAGKLEVVGAVYNLESGAVEWLGRHPGQASLLDGPSSSPEPRSKETALPQVTGKPRANPPVLVPPAARSARPVHE